MSQTLLIFAAIAFIVILTPGPAVLLALSNGSLFGIRASPPGVIGPVLSNLVLIAAVAAGLGALLAASAFWFSVVKWIGVLYLACLGVRMLRSRGTLSLPSAESEGRQTSPRRIFLRSFMVAVTNPKGYVFFSVLLPQFIAPAEPPLPQYLALAGTFAVIDIGVLFGYATAGAQAMRL
jgi:threonine/homoserine/homoserine lactone efflux protein